MPLYQNNIEHKWARYGDIEDDSSLDVVMLDISISFPIITTDGVVSQFGPVLVRLPADLGIKAPMTSYICDWGDAGIPVQINLAERTNDFAHTYTLDKYKNTDRLDTFRVVIKGHNLQDYINSLVNKPGTNYISRKEFVNTDQSAANWHDKTYRITVRKVDI